MARSTLNRCQLKPRAFTRWLVGEMKEQKLLQKDIAQIICVSQQAVAKKIEKNTFSYVEMLMIFEDLETDRETQIKVLL